MHLSSPKPLALLLLGLCLSNTLQAAPSAEPWAFWEPRGEVASVSVDHSLWQAILSAVVVSQADGSTAVRYTAFDATRTEQLQKYVAQLTALDPRTLSRAEQMAYWINLYNALTVQVVLDHPAKNSILRMGGGWLPRGPWDNPVASIAGQSLTLNDIEHRILRPFWQDHRIHFAVNCASVGCPNLATMAYTSDNLDTLLSSAESSFLKHPRAVQFVGQRLVLSSIFDWYMTDFASDRESLLAYLASIRTDLAPRLRGYDGNLKFQYDWALNGATTPD
ncbi:MAG: DUF547 domain-containing protein [Pseudomonadales bacterium]